MYSLRISFIRVTTAPGSYNGTPDAYRRAGFIVDEPAHHYGQARSACRIVLGTEYLELASEEPRGADAAFIGFAAPDLLALLEDWRQRSHPFLPFAAIEPGDTPNARPTAFVPELSLPGAKSGIAEEDSPPNAQTKSIVVAPNTIYALAGALFVSEEPGESAQEWHSLLAPQEPIGQKDNVYQFALGPHYLAWMPPERYEHFYGEPWHQASPAQGEIALVHLLATDLKECRRTLRDTGWVTRLLEHTNNGHRTLWAKPDSESELAFHITEQPVEEWIKVRIAITGESLTTGGSITQNP